MTYIPQAQSITDPNNTYSGTATSFTGTATSTVGYNSVIITVNSNHNSAPLGFKIQSSDDSTTWTTHFSETYFAATMTSKSYQLKNKYYRVYYTASVNSQINITSRLSTDYPDKTCPCDQVSFDNNIENTLDAFGRLRVSNSHTLLDLRFPGQGTGTAGYLSASSKLTTKSNGTYSATYANSKSVISGTGAGYFISQSRNYCVYQPGKSLLYMASCILNPGNSSFVSRLGYFDNEFVTSPSYPTVRNGLYFQYSGGVISVNIKNDTITSTVQTQWNIDTMDGNGPSGINLDFTKTQLVVIDMEWLGVGRVRFGFYAFGRIIYCHQETHINTLTAPYTNSINLPMCMSLHCTSASGSGTITQICSTVISEGGYNPTGYPFSVSNSQDGVDAPVTVDTTEVALLAIRGGGSNYYHQTIIPTGISIIDTATNNNLIYRIRIFRDGIFGGTITWSTVDTGSVVQYAKSAAITATSAQLATGSLLSQEYFYGRGTVAFNGLIDVFNQMTLQLTANADNVADVMILTCQKIGNNSTTVYSTISWQENY